MIEEEIDNTSKFKLQIMIADAVRTLFKENNISDQVVRNVTREIKGDLHDWQSKCFNESKELIKIATSNLKDQKTEVNISPIIAAVAEIKSSIAKIENHILTLRPPEPKKFESLSRKELSERLSISQKELITLEKQKSIPFMKVGKIVRYNWQRVLEFLEKNAIES